MLHQNFFALLDYGGHHRGEDSSCSPGCSRSRLLTDAAHTFLNARDCCSAVYSHTIPGSVLHHVGPATERLVGVLTFRMSCQRTRALTAKLTTLGAFQCLPHSGRRFVFDVRPGLSCACFDKYSRPTLCPGPHEWPLQRIRLRHMSNVQPTFGTRSDGLQLHVHLVHFERDADRHFSGSRNLRASFGKRRASECATIGVLAESGRRYASGRQPARLRLQYKFVILCTKRRGSSQLLCTRRRASS